MSVRTIKASQISSWIARNGKKQLRSPKSVDSDSSGGSYDKAKRSFLPIPKGDSPYALAKNAEYKQRNLDMAEKFYCQAIREGDRAESAVKDLASLLHQRGNTKEACELLEKHRYLFKNDQEKYANLYNTLKKQIDSSGNCQNKCLKMSSLPSSVTPSWVKSLFTNPVRIQEVSVRTEEIDGKQSFFALLSFNSHSSARKTLEGFHLWDKHKIQWVTPMGELAGDAHYARHKMEEYRKHHPTFEYVIFERDPQGYVFSLPLDVNDYCYKEFKGDEQSAEELLGAGLYSTIFKDDLFKDY